MHLCICVCSYLRVQCVYTFSCGIENILFCRMPPRKQATNDGPSTKKGKLILI